MEGGVLMASRLQERPLVWGRLTFVFAVIVPFAPGEAKLLFFPAVAAALVIGVTVRKMRGGKWLLGLSLALLLWVCVNMLVFVCWEGHPHSHWARIFIRILH